MQARGAARLDEVRKADLVAERVDRVRDLDDVRERRALRVEVEDAPVGALGRRDAARPDVQRDRAEVGHVEEGLDVVADEVVDLALRVLAPDALEADPVGREVRGVLLEERLSGDAVGVAGHHERPVLQVGKEPRRDRAVVVDEVALGVALVGPEDLCEVGERNGLLLGLDRGGRGGVRDRGSGSRLAGARIVLAHALLDRLVVADPQERGVAQEAVGRPLLEPHLDDELGLDPDVPVPRRNRAPEGGRRTRFLREAPVEAGELLLGKARSDAAGIDEASVLPRGEVERSETGPRPFRLRVTRPRRNRPSGRAAP